jgi:hypothetical protein
MQITLFGKTYTLEKDLNCRPPRGEHTNDYEYRDGMLEIKAHAHEVSSTITVGIWHEDGRYTELVKTGSFFKLQDALDEVEVKIKDVHNACLQIRGETE